MILEFSWFDHIFAVILLVIIPVMSFRTENLDEDTLDMLPPKKHIFYTNGLMLIIGALLVLSSWNIAHRPWSAIGFDFPQMSKSVLFLVGICVAIYIFDVVYSLVDKKYRSEKVRDLSALIPLNWSEYKHYIFLAFAAGICEEIIFRGFLITYLQHHLGDLLYSNWWAVGIPALAFSVSHLYQGWWAVGKIFAIAVILGLIFIWSGSLLIVMIIHVGIDLISGLMGLGSQVPSDELMDGSLSE